MQARQNILYNVPEASDTVPAGEGVTGYSGRMALELRPLDFGDRLGAAFKLYGANWKTLITIVAIVIIPLQLLAALVGWLLARDFAVDPETGFVDIDAIDGGDIVGFAVLVIVLGIITAIGTLLATAGVMKAVADDALGGEPNWQDSLRFAWSKIGSLIGGSILYGLALAGVLILAVVVFIALIALLDAFGVLLGVILLIAALVLVVILGVSWSVWVPAVIVEGKTAGEALGRSNDLIKGRRGPALGYLFVMGILVALINGVAGGALVAIFTDALAQSVINIALTVLTTPITASAIVVLYFDQRVRNEGFTVDDLAAQIGAATDGGAFGSLPPTEPLTRQTPPEDPPPEGFPSPEGI